MSIDILWAWSPAQTQKKTVDDLLMATSKGRLYSYSMSKGEFIGEFILIFNNNINLLNATLIRSMQNVIKMYTLFNQ